MIALVSIGKHTTCTAFGNAFSTGSKVRHAHTKDGLARRDQTRLHQIIHSYQNRVRKPSPLRLIPTTEATSALQNPLSALLPGISSINIQQPAVQTDNQDVLYPSYGSWLLPNLPVVSCIDAWQSRVLRAFRSVGLLTRVTDSSSTGAPKRLLELFCRSWTLDLPIFTPCRPKG
jgi:hypothetical protein